MSTPPRHTSGNATTPPRRAQLNRYVSALLGAAVLAVWLYLSGGAAVFAPAPPPAHSIPTPEAPR